MRDIRFNRGIMVVPTLSVRHQRETMERTSGPVRKLVEVLSAADPEKLAAYRAECEALAAGYFEENALRQGYLMTRAIKA